jgi:anthranilate synthase component 1
LLAFDHLRHQIHIIAAADVSSESPRKAYDRAVADIEALEKKLAAGVRSAGWENAAGGSRGKLKISSVTPQKTFERAVEIAKEYIAAGDIFQVVLSQRLDFKPDVPPFDIYRALRAVNPSPYMYFLKMGDTRVLGSSPEMLVRVTGSKLEYRPIAGTHPRGKDEAGDRQLEEKMLSDEKERAEHIMLVDLGRNDLGRVSEYGSVKVKDLMYVERYSHVMHIVSNVEGTLKPGLTSIDVLRAAFPAGTVSGAPKVRAMQIIDELEPSKRGVYAGAVGYVSFQDDMDTAIAIRTAIVKDGMLYAQAGAGIVHDSVPESEWTETQNKARAVLRAAEMVQQGLDSEG